MGDRGPHGLAAGSALAGGYGIAVRALPAEDRLVAVAIGLLMGFAFWTNQKAVLHGVPLAVGLVVGVRTGRWRGRDC